MENKGVTCTCHVCGKTFEMNTNCTDPAEAAVYEPWAQEYFVECPDCYKTRLNSVPLTGMDERIPMALKIRASMCNGLIDYLGNNPLSEVLHNGRMVTVDLQKGLDAFIAAHTDSEYWRNIIVSNWWIPHVSSVLPYVADWAHEDMDAFVAIAKTSCQCVSFINVHERDEEPEYIESEYREREYDEGRKYRLTNKMKIVDFHVLHRIRAIRSFGNVTEGNYGGWIQYDRNLSHEGTAWVYSKGCVYDNATVFHSGIVCSYAHVAGDAAVYENGIVGGHALLYKCAEVKGQAMVDEDAVMCGHAHADDSAHVSGNAEMCDRAEAGDNAVIDGNAKLSGYAKVSGCAVVSDNAVVSGNVHIDGNTILANNAMVSKPYDVVTISGIGGSDYSITAFRCADNEVRVVYDMLNANHYRPWNNDIALTLPEFEECIHTGTPHENAYIATLEFIRTIFAMKNTFDS